MSEPKLSTLEAVAALEERLATIRTLVHERFHREVESVSPLGRDSNNFVNLVQLKPLGSVKDVDHDLPPQNGTLELDPSVTKIVVRISNSNAMLDEGVRVENEVAAIALMHRALAKLPYIPVPKVFAWEVSSSAGSGWIAEEFMEGEMLSGLLPDFSLEKKTLVLDQVAELFGMIQVFDSELDGFGGLGFDANGKVVARRSSLWSVGPFANYADMYQGIFIRQLELTATTPLLDGWKEGDLEERLYRFNASGGFKSLLQPFETMKSTLVHGDISAENILIDPETHQITGLLDFDFSHIGSPADEFFYSFMEFGGLVPGPFEGGDLDRLRDYQIQGFPESATFEAGEDTPIDLNTAQLWQAAQKKHKVNGPANIAGIAELADIYWFLLDVCPPFFNMPQWLAKRTEEQKQATKATIRTSLDRYLTKWGY